MNKLVTICIPTFNSEVSLFETLESLVKQTYSNIRVIIFDNCSSDNTIIIAEGFRNKFKYFEIRTSDKNIGAEGNFTKCLQVEDSDFTAIFHADDIYAENIVEKQVQAFLENPKLLAVSTHANEIDAFGKKVGERFLPKELRDKPLTVLDFNQLFELTVKYGNIITCPSVMAKTEVYAQRIKFWDGDKFKSSADLDLWLRVSKLGEFGFLSEPLINYRMADVSISFRMKKVRVVRHDFFLVLDSYLDEVKRLKLSKYYDFLCLKDLALRVYNGSGEKLRPFKKAYVPIVIKSRWHIGVYIKVILIWIVSFLNRVKIVR